MKMKSYLQALMDEANITQQALALATGLSATTIAKIQRNRFDRIDNVTVKTLCRYFGLESINQLIDVEWETTDEPGAGALPADD